MATRFEPGSPLSDQRSAALDLSQRDSGLRLAELVAAFSLAMDLGLGQPMEHVLRAWLIASRLVWIYVWKDTWQGSLLGCAFSHLSLSCRSYRRIAFRIAETHSDNFIARTGKLSRRVTAWLYEVIRHLVTEVVVCDPRRNTLLGEGSKAEFGAKE